MPRPRSAFVEQANSHSGSSMPPVNSRLALNLRPRKIFDSRRSRKRQAPSLQNADTNTNPNSNNATFPSGHSFPKGFFPMIIPDNSPAVQYSGPWVLNATRQATTHSTRTPNSGLSLRFKGNGITVFGIVPQSFRNFPPPTAVYTIDEGIPVTTTLPQAVTSIPNQPLFASAQNLTADAEHTLTINVTFAVTPYTVQRFFVSQSLPAMDMIGQLPSGGIQVSQSTAATTASMSPSATLQAASPASTHWSESSQKTIKILASILGLAAFFMIVAGSAFFILRRRNRMREKSTALPTVTCPEAEKARPDTLYTYFTSTESILRNDDAIWSPSFRSPRSHYSRSARSISDGRSRSASDGRRSIDFVPPPLPPKPGILIIPALPGH